MRASYTDPAMQDVGAMASKSIDTYIGYLDINDSRNMNLIGITVQHRFCHLIYRMETSLCWETAIGAKWYLGNVNLPTMPPPLVPYLEPLRARLQALIDQYEAKYGVVSVEAFDRAVYHAGWNYGKLICGGPLFSFIEPSRSTPEGFLSRFISDNMWIQTSVSNRR